MSALIIATVLTRLYNNCINTGTYPKIRKTDQLTPCELYQFIRVMPRIGAAIKDPYLCLPHLVRSLKNACTKKFTLILYNMYHLLMQSEKMATVAQEKPQK